MRACSLVSLRVFVRVCVCAYLNACLLATCLFACLFECVFVFIQFMRVFFMGELLLSYVWVY